MGDFYTVGRENAGEFGLKLVNFNAEGETNRLFLGAFHENEDDFLNAGMEIAKTADFGELFVVIGIFNQAPEALMAIVLRWSNRGGGSFRS